MSVKDKAKTAEDTPAKAGPEAEEELGVPVMPILSDTFTEPGTDLGRCPAKVNPDRYAASLQDNSDSGRQKALTEGLRLLQWDERDPLAEVKPGEERPPVLLNPDAFTPTADGYVGFGTTIVAVETVAHNRARMEARKRAAEAARDSVKGMTEGKIPAGVPVEGTVTVTQTGAPAPRRT
jgi:hypothetical protein